MEGEGTDAATNHDRRRETGRGQQRHRSMDWDAEFMKHQPGFIRTQLYRGICAQRLRGLSQSHMAYRLR